MEKRKKILFVITKSNWGGAQRYVYDLATSLPKEEFDVSVALGGAGEWKESPGKLGSKLIGAHVRTILVKNFMRNVWVVPDILAFFELVAVFFRERPHIVHLNSSKAGAMGAVAGRIAGIKKIVFTSHGLVYDEDRNFFAKIVLWKVTWLTFLLSHSVITISKDTFFRAQKFPLCARKIFLVHNGIPLLPLKTKEEARNFLGITGEKGFVLGTISELTKNKGLSYLIAAAEELKKNNVPFSLYIVGEGAERKELERAIRQKGLTLCVTLMGFVENAALYLKAFDVFALTSVKEGLPYVLLEAGQAALPVVGSSIPGILDIIENRKSGLLVTPKESGEIAVALMDYYRNKGLRDVHGMALYKRVLTVFSAKEMAQQSALIYRS